MLPCSIDVKWNTIVRNGVLVKKTCQSEDQPGESEICEDPYESIQKERVAPHTMPGLPDVPGSDLFVGSNVAGTLVGLQVIQCLLEGLHG